MCFTMFKKPKYGPVFSLQNIGGAEIRDINYFSRFINKNAGIILDISPTQFFDITRYYCASGYDYVAPEKMDQFIADYLELQDYEESNPPYYENKDVKPKVAKALHDAKVEAFIDTYDLNRDGKISIRELSKMLPLQQPFNQLFYLRKALTGSFDFLTLFKYYDKNGDGNIDFNELKQYVKDTFNINPRLDVDDTSLCLYTSVLLKIYDFDNDGILHLSEMWSLVNIRNRIDFKNLNLSEDSFEDLVRFYDREKKGMANDFALRSALIDVCATSKKSFTMKDIESLMKSVHQSLKDNDVEIDREYEGFGLILAMLHS